MLRPVIPVIEYNINYDYIVKVLCINKDKPELNCKGKCQLAKEIKKTLPIKTENRQPAFPVIDFDKFQLTFHKTEQSNFNFFNTLNTFNFFKNISGKTKNYITSVFQPPDVLV